MQINIDLGDDIGTDDWLIAKEEVTKKRLIKETSRFKIFKADWFGDVLFYEPNRTAKRSSTRRHQMQHCDTDAARLQEHGTTFHFDPLSLEPESFSTRESPNIREIYPTNACPLSPTGSIESGYSSASSTPRNHAHQTEFSFFPGSSASNSETAWDPLQSSIGSTSGSESSHQQQEEVQREEPGNGCKSCSLQPAFPVVLNRDSFKYEAFSAFGACDNICHNMDDCNAASESSWFELNELRLIAHENFMLFMGACLEPIYPEECTNNQATALVMEMSHPKASSLFNLLHADNTTANTCSLSNRFSIPGRSKTTLDLTSKLSICQQVKNAMTYLHDKNIVHGKLTSVNIYLEQNQWVKISLIDHDEQQLATIGCDSGQNYGMEYDDKYHNNADAVVSFNLPALTYLSPELVQTISIERDNLRSNLDRQQKYQLDPDRLTKKSDVFSFGTLLFELFEERFPFAQSNRHFSESLSDIASALSTPSTIRHELEISDGPFFTRSPLPQMHRQQYKSPLDKRVRHGWDGNIKMSASELIFQIGSGLIGHLNPQTTRCPSHIVEIIAACWASSPDRRPDFKQFPFEHLI